MLFKLQRSKKNRTNENNTAHATHKHQSKHKHARNKQKPTHARRQTSSSLPPECRRPSIPRSLLRTCPCRSRKPRASRVRLRAFEAVPCRMARRLRDWRIKSERRLPRSKTTSAAASESESRLWQSPIPTSHEQSPCEGFDLSFGRIFADH